MIFQEVDIWQILIGLLSVIAIKWFITFVFMLISYPSGPWGLPVVGYIPWMDIHAERSFVSIGKKYKSVFSVTLGTTTVVVLNDWPAIKEALVDNPKQFNGRPKNIAIDTAIERKDVGFSDGPIWEEQRNLTVQCLKNAGLGKSSMESVVNDSVHDVMEVLSFNDGKVVEMKNVFFVAIAKTTWRMVASHNTFHSENQEFLNFNQGFRNLFEKFSPNCPFNAFPWLRFVPPNGFGFKDFMQAQGQVMNYLRSLVESHEKSWTEGAETDFIDFYLSKMKKENASGTNRPPYTTDYLMGVVWDMFLGGIDTTNATLLWGFLYLSCNPEVQTEAQKELDSVVGRNRLPCLNDFTKLPYTEALIMEIHRLANVIPLSIPHQCKQTTKVCNISIPKGATVLQNIYAVHLDPNLWEEPTKFNPKRFINERNEAKWPPYLMPFSIGPRLCLGRTVADVNLKLIVSCLLHQFHFSLPLNQPYPSFIPIPGLSEHPQPYSLVVKSRNDEVSH